jgi:cytochrome P450
MFGKMTVYISDPDLIGQVFGNPDATQFPKTAASYDVVRDGLLGDGLVTSQGETWKFHRHIITPLFHFKVRSYMFEEKCILCFLDHV